MEALLLGNASNQLSLHPVGRYRNENWRLEIQYRIFVRPVHR